MNLPTAEELARECAIKLFACGSPECTLETEQIAKDILNTIPLAELLAVVETSLHLKDTLRFAPQGTKKFAEAYEPWYESLITIHSKLSTHKDSTDES